MNVNLHKPFNTISDIKAAFAEAGWKVENTSDRGYYAVSYTRNGTRETDTLDLTGLRNVLFALRTSNGAIA